MVVFRTLVEGWMVQEETGSLLVHEARGRLNGRISTLVEGWMVQEEAGSPLVVHEALGQVEWLYSVPWSRVGWYRKRQALPGGL